MEARKIVFGLALISGLTSTGAQATLFDRGGGLIYDDVLDITWLQDANYAKTSGYDADGKMTWDQAIAWADGLSYYDSVRDVTYDDWRLPFMVDTATSGCDFAYTGTDCGYNVQTTSGATVYSEMASLWYDTLGNLAFFDTSGGGGQTGWGLTNRGPFGSSLQSYDYWSGNEYAPDPGFAWSFSTYNGGQDEAGKNSQFSAWAVRPGDVAANNGIPLPGTLLLMAAGFLGLGVLKRRLLVIR